MGRRRDNSPIWQEIKCRYERGENANKISKDVGIPYHTIYRRAKRDGWISVRSAPKAQLVEKHCYSPKQQKLHIVPEPPHSAELCYEPDNWEAVSKSHQDLAFKARHRLSKYWDSIDNQIGLPIEVQAVSEKAAIDILKTIIQLERQIYSSEILMEQRHAVQEQETINKVRVHERFASLLKRAKNAKTGTDNT